MIRVQQRRTHRRATNFIVFLVGVYFLFVGTAAVTVGSSASTEREAQSTLPLFELSLLCNPPENKSGHVPRALDHYDAQARYDAVPDFNGTSTVKVRFVATHTKKDKQLFDFVTTARLAGVPVEILGLGWKGFSLINRQKLIVDYAIAANLSDEDVVVMLDSDMLFTGVDMFPVLQRFVSYSPKSPKELVPRHVRLGQQTAPVLFTGENNCMALQAIPEALCEAPYQTVSRLFSKWIEDEGVATDLEESAGIALERENCYLNNGLILGRVWGLKKLRYSFVSYTRSNFPTDGKVSWFMDQGVYSMLYLQLRYWELRSGILAAGAEHPQDRTGPYSLLGGMLDLDYRNQFVGAFHQLNIPHQVMYAGLAPSCDRSLKHIVSLVRERWRHSEVQPNRTPTGAAYLPNFFSFIPKHLSASIDASLNGKDHSTSEVNDQTGTSPLIWHLCGPEKVQWMPIFMEALPTRMVLDVFPKERSNTCSVFWSIPPNKVWSVNEDSVGTERYYLLQHFSDFDLTVESLCALIDV